MAFFATIAIVVTIVAAKTATAIIIVHDKYHTFLDCLHVEVKDAVKAAVRDISLTILNCLVNKIEEMICKDN